VGDLFFLPRVRGRIPLPDFANGMARNARLHQTKQILFDVFSHIFYVYVYNMYSSVFSALNISLALVYPQFWQIN